MKRISQDKVKLLAKKYKIDLNKVPLTWLTKGVNIELEHGSKISKMTNVTKNSLDLTFKIALAHLLEYPDYYQRLDKMEKKAEKYWKNKNKNIFL